jgi:hypothetical protein
MQEGEKRMKSLKILLPIVLLIFVGCAAQQKMVFYNGDIAAQNFTRMVTTDGSIEAVYAPVVYTKHRVGNESMLWPNYVSVREELNLPKGTYEKVTFILKIINPEQKEYKLVYNYEAFSSDGNYAVDARETVLYRGRLPYREFEVDCPIIGDRVKLWFDFKRDGRIIAFTQPFKDSRIER